MRGKSGDNSSVQSNVIYAKETDATIASKCVPTWEWNLNQQGERTTYFHSARVTLRSQETSGTGKAVGCNPVTCRFVPERSDSVMRMVASVDVTISSNAMGEGSHERMHFENARHSDL